MQVHGKCETVVTKFRPVPLSWQFCYQHEDQARLLPLLAKRGRALNPQLQPPPSEKYLGVDWGRYDKLKSAQLQCASGTLPIPQTSDILPSHRSNGLAMGPC